MSVGAIPKVGFKPFLCSLFLLFVIHLAFTESPPLPYPDKVAKPDQLADLATEENVFEVSEVSILGAVQKPGIYDYVNGMRISDQLFLASGVSPNTYLREAE